jgi:RND family efflux transporter MFP subunit
MIATARWLSIGVVVAAFYACLASAGCSACSESRGSDVTTEGRKTPVRVERVSVEEVDEYRRISGDVKPWQLLPLSFKVGGRVSKLEVAEGSKVEKNALVAVMDARDYWLTRKLAKAQVKALEPHLDRAKALYEQNALAKSELQKIQGKMRAARVQYEQAQAQLSYVNLRSPISGVVVKKLVSVGDLVGPTRPVVAVAKLETVKVELPVAQTDLQYFRKGTEVEISAAGLGRSYRGTIETVGYAADSSTRTFPVTVRVENEDLTLRAGMIVQARVKIATHRGIFVPLSAISRDIRGRPMVLVVGEKGSRAAGRVVELGARLGERVQVKKGLAQGDKVILRGLVSPGDPIRVCEGDDRKCEQPDRGAS